MKFNLSKALLLATGVVVLSSSLLILTLKTTKSLVPDCTKSSTTYI